MLTIKETGCGIYGNTLLYSQFFCKSKTILKLKVYHRDFPGGTVVKNPPANAGDTGLISGPGRCHRATKPMCHNY